jgi:peroxiredoxin
VTCPRWVVPIVLLAVVVSGCSVGGGSACPDRIAGVRPGLCLRDPGDRPEAPAATFPVLGQPDRQLGVGDFAGDVLVVNFWASWCGPCRSEQPELNAAYEELTPLGVSFLGVSLQDTSEANALAHQDEFSIPYPSLWDPSSRYAADFKGVGPRTLPSTVLIDPQGRIAATILGETDAEEVTTLVRMLASESG